MKLFIDISKKNKFIVLRVLGTVLNYAKGFLLPVLVYQQSGGSTIAAGVAYFIEFLPQTILSPIFGSLVDRSNGKKLVYGVEVCRFALITFWAIFAYNSSAWMLSSLISICSGLSLLFYEATASQRLNKEELNSFQAVTQLFEPFSRLVGPGLVAGLLVFISAETIVLLLAIFYGIAGLLSAIWHEDTKRIITNTISEPWSVKNEVANLSNLATNHKLMTLTISTGFLNGFFGVFQSLLIPTMIGYYKMNSSESSVPNIVGGLFSLIIILILPKFKNKISISQYGVLGSVSLLVSGVMVMSNINSTVFSLAFGMLILGSSLFGIYFRAKRLELIHPSQLAQGIGATSSILMLFLPLSGLVTIFAHSYSPLMVIGISGVVSAAIVFLGMLCLGQVEVLRKDCCVNE